MNNMFYFSCIDMWFFLIFKIFQTHILNKSIGFAEEDIYKIYSCNQFQVYKSSGISGTMYICVWEVENSSKIFKLLIC